ncbi:glycosyltransferase [Glaciecola sp. 1036]|uniref:glycosyltransferase n=1 Tax=Alteromonadaceae TaxID=72275 RepID=UPI003D04C385
MADQKQIVFIGYVWPESQTTAAGQNILSYLKTFLEDNWVVHFFCAAATSQYSDNLLKLGIKIQQVELNNDSFNSLIKQISPQVVIFDRFLTEEQFGWRVAQHSPQTVRVLDCEDLHFLRTGRKDALKDLPLPRFQTSDFVLSPAHKKYLLNDKCYREIASILRCDLSIVLSSFERQLLISEFNVPDTQISHIPFIRDIKIAPSREFSERQHLISIGSLLHEPNVISTEILIDLVMPVIRKQIPDVELHIVGRYAPHRITQRLNAKKGILLKDYVEDHLAEISQHRLLVSPLTFGAGIKGKIIDSFATNTPSITTPIGSEGIEVKPWPGAVVDNIDAFCQAIIDLYTDEDAWNKAASDCLQAKTDSGVNLQQNKIKLLNDIKYIQENLQQHRRQHFLQALLTHQNSYASKYMGQWITAKNKLKDLMSDAE